jgi:hypothetical protein
MSVELPKDAKGREIPLDTVVLSKTRQPVAVVMQEDGRLREVNVSNVIIDDSYEVFDMYLWTFNENDITEQLGAMRKED